MKPTVRNKNDKPPGCVKQPGQNRISRLGGTVQCLGGFLRICVFSFLYSEGTVLLIVDFCVFAT